MPHLGANAWDSRHSRKRIDGSLLRRNPGREDGSAWKSKEFICTPAIDDHSIDDPHDDKESIPPETFSPVTFKPFSLFDDARIKTCKSQRKAKTKLGDFEILESNPKVMPIDNDCSDADADEWEQVDVSDIPAKQSDIPARQSDIPARQPDIPARQDRMTYSEVLRTG